MSERYKVVEGSETGHCCFGATVVDTHTPRNGWEEKFDWVCECYGLKDAQKIADALNAAEQSPDVAQLVEALELARRTLAMAAIEGEVTRRIDRLRAENEQLRMQLAACGVVALANTPESAAQQRAMYPDYMSESCRDVMRAVDREMALRARLGEIEGQEPVAYAVFADNGNIRIWCADPIQAETLRQQYGDQLKPLYAAPQPAEQQPEP